MQDWLRGGGTEKHTVLYANGFSGFGHAVTVLTFRPGGVLADSLTVNHEVLQPFDCHLSFLAPGLGKRLQLLRPDVVLAMGYEANRKLPRLRQVLPTARLVASLRGGRALSTGYKRALCEADLVMTNSEWARERAINVGTQAKKTVAVNNLLGRKPPFVDAARRNDIREAFLTKTDDRVLVCVAGFRRGKGQVELIGMLAPMLRHSPVKLWLVGDGPERASCEKLAAVLDVQEKVIFSGRRADVMEILQSADIYVHASRMESQPNALIEAQACGLPVIALDVAGVKETFEDKVSGLLIPENSVQQYKAAVMEMLDSDIKRHSFGKAGKAFALEKFDDMRNLRTTLDILSSII